MDSIDKIRDQMIDNINERLGIMSRMHENTQQRLDTIYELAFGASSTASKLHARFIDLEKKVERLEKDNPHKPTQY